MNLINLPMADSTAIRKLTEKTASSNSDSTSTPVTEPAGGSRKRHTITSEVLSGLSGLGVEKKQKTEHNQSEPMQCDAPEGPEGSKDASSYSPIRLHVSSIDGDLAGQ